MKTPTLSGPQRSAVSLVTKLCLVTPVGEVLLRRFSLRTLFGCATFCLTLLSLLQPATFAQTTGRHAAENPQATVQAEPASAAGAQQQDGNQAAGAQQQAAGLGQNRKRGGGGLGGLGGGMSPQPQLPKLPDTLEEMLAIALRSNPDVLLAEAKLREAQAQLNQARLKVTQEVVSLYHERKKQQELHSGLNQQYRRARQSFDVGAISSEQLTGIIAARTEAASAVPQAEAQIRYLLGLGGQAPTAQQSQAAPASESTVTATRPEIPEKFFILETEVAFDFPDTPLEVVMRFLNDEYRIPVLIDGAVRGGIGSDYEIDFSARNLTLRNALQAMLDTIADEKGYPICFVFRDYGVLVTTPKRAEQLYGATIPPEIPMRASAVPPKAQ